MARRLAGPDLPGHLDGPAKEEELFGNGCFAGIRVADNGKGAATINFLRVEFLHFHAPLKNSGQKKGEEDIFARFGAIITF
jgi:hypothetical protein